MKKRKRGSIVKHVIWVLAALLLIGGGLAAWFWYGPSISNPHNYKTIGEIATPMGFERVKVEVSSYGAFLRNLPLKPKGSNVMLFTGGKAHGQRLNYAVVDLPLISNWEQCADCCMRLRAEYLKLSCWPKEQHQLEISM